MDFVFRHLGQFADFLGRIVKAEQKAAHFAARFKIELLIAFDVIELDQQLVDGRLGELGVAFKRRGKGVVGNFT